ncbi:hypothetical protein [Erwinia amylovora]|uniref:hypothetical protein n=1 Tax=Erwinia amylovora TaxID=552 RepID=UPI00144483E6|nr:hypothetical protein [Erwinia amylovora]
MKAKISILLAIMTFTTVAFNASASTSTDKQVVITGNPQMINLSSKANQVVKLVQDTCFSKHTDQSSTMLEKNNAINGCKEVAMKALTAFSQCAVYTNYIAINDDKTNSCYAWTLDTYNK